MTFARLSLMAILMVLMSAVLSCSSHKVSFSLERPLIEMAHCSIGDFDVYLPASDSTISVPSTEVIDRFKIAMKDKLDASLLFQTVYPYNVNATYEVVCTITKSYTDVKKLSFAVRLKDQYSGEVLFGDSYEYAIDNWEAAEPTFREVSSKFVESLKTDAKRLEESD